MIQNPCDNREELKLILQIQNLSAWIYEIETQTIKALHRCQTVQKKDTIHGLYEKIVDLDVELLKKSISDLTEGTKEDDLIKIRMKGDGYKMAEQHFEVTLKRFALNEINDGSIIIIFRNITADVHLQKELVEMRDKAEASNRLKSAFLANMSHEIRTPLNAIVGFCDLLTDHDNDDDLTEEDRIHFRDSINMNSDVLLNLINDILDLSRIEAGSFSFTYKNFDFVAWFNNLTRGMNKYKSNGVELIIKSPLNELWVHSEPTRLAQVVTNFTTNAFKFTKKGSVTIAYEYKDESLEISVSDTGIGIAKDKMNDVFDRFIKLNDFEKGTGLGLAICKAIIKAMGGEIGVQSTAGEGSVFWVKIPCILIPTPTVEEENIENKVIYKSIIEPSALIRKDDSDLPTVLIAEDNDNNFIITKEMIRSKYTVYRASNGYEAVEKAKSLKPDLILMDMIMPGLDGIEATKLIKEARPEVPVVALTAYMLDTPRQEALDAGCIEYLTKPVNKNITLEILENLINPTEE